MLGERGRKGGEKLKDTIDMSTSSPPFFFESMSCRLPFPVLGLKKVKVFVGGTKVEIRDPRDGENGFFFKLSSEIETQKSGCVGGKKKN